MSTDGFLNINKPSGITSFQVVARVRRWSHQKKVGHAGTLDPLASGVLPVAVGRATRMLEFLVDTRKGYRAHIELGKTTDTYDGEGRTTASADPSGVTQAQLESALDRLRGILWQTPPPYSAVRYQGKHLYQLARAGITVAPSPRRAEVFRLEIADWQLPLLTVEIECSKGTYVRSLAHDLGQLLGCGAYLKSLLRTWSGPFRLENSIPLERFEDAVTRTEWHGLLYPPDFVVTHWKTVVLDKLAEQAMAQGKLIALPQDGEVPPDARQQPSNAPEDRRRAYSQDGRFLGVLVFRQDTQAWHPRKVFL